MPWGSVAWVGLPLRWSWSFPGNRAGELKAGARAAPREIARIDELRVQKDGPRWLEVGRIS